VAGKRLRTRPRERWESRYQEYQSWPGKSPAIGLNEMEICEKEQGVKEEP